MRVKEHLHFIRKWSSLYLLNFIFQKISGTNRVCQFLVHFTSKVIHGRNIVIYGNNKWKVIKSFFASGGCYFQAQNGIEIGEGTRFGPNVVVVSSSYDYNVGLASKKIETPVHIGRYCWLGAGVVITPGVFLGDYTIVGANSVVTKSFPDGFQIIAGVPAKVIKKLNKEEILKHLPELQSEV